MLEVLDGQAESVKSQLAEQGYCIVKNVIDVKRIESMRTFWLRTMKQENVSKRFVSGNLVLGENNFLSYSRVKDSCLYRNFDFLWNVQSHDQTTELCIEIHRFRNRIQDLDENYGLRYNRDNYGIYISTSLYPPGEGMLAVHRDSHDAVPIIHFMVPMTFKNRDYEQGGLTIKDKSGKMVDIDSYCAPGDLIFFDGICEHGVDTIRGGICGRLAVFAIPTYFKRDAKSQVALRSAKILSTEITEKLPFVGPGLLASLRAFRRVWR
jgi:hypothetical protein